MKGRVTKKDEEEQEDEQEMFTVFSIYLAEILNFFWGMS